MGAVRKEFLALMRWMAEGSNILKRGLMSIYEHGWISFRTCEFVSSYLRRWAWFREG